MSELISAWIEEVREEKGETPLTRALSEASTALRSAGRDDLLMGIASCLQVASSGSHGLVGEAISSMPILADAINRSKGRGLRGKSDGLNDVMARLVYAMICSGRIDAAILVGICCNLDGSPFQQQWRDVLTGAFVVHATILGEDLSDGYRIKTDRFPTESN